MEEMWVAATFVDYIVNHFGLHVLYTWEGSEGEENLMSVERPQSDMKECSVVGWGGRFVDKSKAGFDGGAECDYVDDGRGQWPL